MIMIEGGGDMIKIKRIDDTSRDWAREAFLKWWTAPFVVSREKRLYFDDMPGFVVYFDRVNNPTPENR